MQKSSPERLFLSIVSQVREVVERAGLSGRRLLVALSGGLDSVCLLHLLREMEAGEESVLEVAHVDHGLRPDSSEDASFCEALARRMGLPFHLLRADRTRLGRGRGVQAEARALRRDWLERVREERRLSAVALGHHADDQVETVLYRLLRGTGPRGMGGMEEWAAPYLRPLLGQRRQDLERLAAEQGWAHRDDPTNREALYARNLLRLRALPVLRTVHPGADSAVVRTARLLAEDDRYLSDLAGRTWAEVAAAEPEGFRIPVRVLRGIPPPLRRRLYLIAWERAGCDTGVLEARHLEEVDRLLSPGRSQRRAPVPGPGAFAASYGDLWILRGGVLGPEPVEVRVGPGQGAAVAPLGLEARWGGSPPADRPAVAVPAGRGAGGAVLRSWRPGDRLERLGRAPVKVKDLLMRARLPPWRRSRALVVEDGEGIFGVLAGGRAWALQEGGDGWVWLQEPGAQEP